MMMWKLLSSRHATKYGFIVDLKRKTIAYVDSLHPQRKEGKWSIVQTLREIYFPGVEEDQVECTSFFYSRVQFVSSSCENFVLGVDRTFNLGSFYVTALVCKNQRVVRKDNPSEHPLFLGPIFLHKEANYESYHTSFSAIKGKLCSKDNIRVIEIRFGNDVLFGSDQEKALINAIESVFLSSTRFVCTKHTKDHIRANMKDKVPQKDREQILKCNIFCRCR